MKIPSPSVCTSLKGVKQDARVCDQEWSQLVGALEKMLWYFLLNGFSVSSLVKF